MYSIRGAHKALSCSRNTIYLMIREAGIKTTKSGCSERMTDEQFQRLQEIYLKRKAATPMRRIVKSFAIRLDLLEKLEAEAPKGERSAFLERLLEREFEKRET